MSDEWRTRARQRCSLASSSSCSASRSLMSQTNAWTRRSSPSPVDQAAISIGTSVPSGRR